MFNSIDDYQPTIERCKMQLEEDGRVGLEEMFGVDPREGRALQLVKRMDADIGTIARLEIVNMPDEPKQMEPLGSMSLVANDAESFVTLMNTYSAPEMGIVFVDGSTIVGIFDKYQTESLDDKRSHMGFVIEKHKVFRRWMSCLGGRITHRNLFEFMQENIDDIQNHAPILLAWSQIITAYDIERNVTLDDGYFKNISFKSATRSRKRDDDKTEATKLPCEFTIKVPVLAGKSDELSEFRVCIDIYEPTNNAVDNEPMFCLRSRDMEYAVDDFMETVVDYLKEELSYYPIVYGAINH